MDPYNSVALPYPLHSLLPSDVAGIAVAPAMHVATSYLVVGTFNGSTGQSPAALSSSAQRISSGSLSLAVGQVYTMFGVDLVQLGYSNLLTVQPLQLVMSSRAQDRWGHGAVLCCAVLQHDGLGP